MTAAEAAAPGPDPILDAARATVLDFGVRRTTVIEVARRAGLSRMTVYRRYPDGQALIRAVMAREFSAVMKQASAEAQALAGADGRERAVTAAVRTVELLQSHPVLLRLLELEPELLWPYVSSRPGRFQQLSRATLAQALVAGQEDGSVRAGDPAELAEAIELAARGYVLAAQAAPPLPELRSMLHAYLRPE